MSARAWPAVLEDGPVGLRPLRRGDGAAWIRVRVRNERWLAPWEGRPPSSPLATWAERHTAVAFAAMLRSQRREAKAGRMLPFALTYDGRLAGQVTVGGIVHGAYDGAYVGYWVDGALAGRGVVPTAVALAVDHCFDVLGLHRVEANVRPENLPSTRVVEKLGFREEGVRRRFLFIDEDWRDHVCWALTREDVPEGLLRRWHATR